MKFRIMKNNQGFYPQVKQTWFKPWERIVKEFSGYRLYPKKYTDYPCESAEEARVIIDKFYDWIKEDDDKLELVKYHDPTDRVKSFFSEHELQGTYMPQQRSIYAKERQ